MPGLFGKRRALPAYHVRLFGPETPPDGIEQWAAAFEEIPGCLAQGASPGQAEATLWRILPQYLHQLRSRHLPIPGQMGVAALSIAGVSIVMPDGTEASVGNPARTVPLGASADDRKTAALRADCGLIGS